MNGTLKLSKEEYKELMELVFIGSLVKTGDINFKSYEDSINNVSNKLANYIYSQAEKFNCENLIETHEEELPGQFFLNNGDDLVEEYFDF